MGPLNKKIRGKICSFSRGNQRELPRTRDTKQGGGGQMWSEGTQRANGTQDACIIPHLPVGRARERRLSILSNVRGGGWGTRRSGDAKVGRQENYWC